MDDEANRTLYVGNLGGKVTEDILYELFLQAGPVNYVRIPEDRTTKQPKAFGFICFKDECSVPFAVHLLDSASLFGRNINVQRRGKGQVMPPITSVGIHSLDPEAGPEINAAATSLLSQPHDSSLRPRPLNDIVLCPPLQGYGSNQQGPFNQQGLFNQQRFLNQQAPFNQQRGSSNGYQASYFDARSIIDTNRLNDFKSAYETNYSQSGDNSRQRYSTRSDRYDSGNNQHWGHDTQRSQSNYRERRNDPYDRTDRYPDRDNHHRSKSYRDNDNSRFYERDDMESRNHQHQSRSSSHREDDRHYQSHRSYTTNRY